MLNNLPVDIVMLCWNRWELTANTVDYLRRRTKNPYRLFVIDNASDDKTPELLVNMEKSGDVFHSLRMSKNVGVHMGWNTAASLVESEYFITTDNDCYVPDVDPDWLSQLVKFMDERPDYGAIALQPHMFLGCSDPTPDPSGVTEVGHCGAVMRLMRKDAVLKAGGWDRHFNANRNHEELTICSRLKTAGYKLGYCSYLRCYHDFGNDNNWGYKEVHPRVHGHRIPGGSKFAEGGPGEIWPSPEAMKSQDAAFDTKTWIRK
jgi:GT2 family glycosyltransferase